MLSLAAASHGGLLVLLSMPVVAAFIGYLTKLVAVEMMFRPIEFKGIGPFGWQGMVPRRAAKMASIAVDTLTSRLLEPRELLEKIDADDLVAALEQPLRDAVDEIAGELVGLLHPALWQRLPEAGRNAVVAAVHSRVPALVDRVLADMHDDLDAVFDLKYIVVSNLVRDKVLLNRLFRELAQPEMKFIVRSGLVTGCGIGLVQATVWGLTHDTLVMPVFGLMTGWLSDWLALTMIFRPVRERRIFGPLRWHGLFHKRRTQLSAQYGEIMAREILTPSVVLDAMLTGPTSDRLFAMIDRAVRDAIEDQVGPARPVVTLAVGSARYEELKRTVVQRALDRVPETTDQLAAYADDAIDVRTTIVGKMQQLTVEEYENILRPVFKSDEKTLIAVGALLGFLVGELQVFLVTHL